MAEPNGQQSKASSSTVTGPDKAWDAGTAGSSIVRLARSKQTWTGAGSAAGIVLRYLGPMRRLAIDICGDEAAADHALGILIQHLVNAGFGDQNNGLLRDFLIRGIRSAAKAQREHSETKERERKEKLQLSKEPYVPAPPPPPLRFADAKSTSPLWIKYWSDGLLERAWRSLERHQHAARFRVDAAPENVGAKASSHDLVHDVLYTVMNHAGESATMLSGRVAALSGRPVSQEETRAQLAEARILLAQFIADEVAQTIDKQDAKLVQQEIKTLELQKAFAGLAITK